nr:hypothetical protein CFP56_34683 [Quercus suber]
MDRDKQFLWAATATLSAGGLTPLQIQEFDEAIAAHERPASFAGLLLEVYCSLKPALDLVPMRDYIGILGTSEQRRHAAAALTKNIEARLDGLYEERVLLAIRELALDRDQVEERFRVAATGKTYTEVISSTGNVSRLRIVNQKDLASLRQIVLFQPELRDAQYCVELKARSLLQPSLWATLATSLGLSDEQPRFSHSSASARSRLSAEALAKKTL